MTNRDLYLALTSLPETGRSLEDYLRALLTLGRGRRFADELDPRDFAAMLEEAMSAGPAPFDPAWRAGRRDEAADPFAAWEAALIGQVVDLREMAENGQLAKESRYFGLDSPRGRRWYNFTPAAYLEAAVTGTFGGWQPDDDTGRQYVPGPYVALDEGGELVERQPGDESEQVEALGPITWGRFATFLCDGQSYE